MFQWITSSQPALVLAPMEGVTDAPMRALLTERGGFNFCVSEFLRISHQLLPPHCYIEHVPELSRGGRTPSDTPVQFQLLGGDEELMALSSARACELGAKAIDLNFGCPAPLVNRRDGGAFLLRHPGRIRKIVKAVREAVPAPIPVSAKLRLGWESMEDIFVNAEQAALGGANWITIHARTRMQGYLPPAYWKYIGAVKRQLEIPVIANGEIWTVEDFLRCQEQTQCQHFMIGRGALRDPALPREIARQLGITLPSLSASDASEGGGGYPFGREPRDWEPLLRRYVEFTDLVSQNSQYSLCRIKQWLRFACRFEPLPWFEDLKRVQRLEDLFSLLRSK